MAVAKQLRLRRGTTDEHADFTGAEGEITYDSVGKRAVVHDGATAGGFPMAKKSEAADKIPLSYLDTDDTLAADSDEKVPSQKAVKAYVDANAGGGDFIPLDYLDTDEALTADSDEKVPTQQAVKGYVDGLAADVAANFIPSSYLDTDTALAADSDSKIASQKATKAYVDANAGIPMSYLDTDGTMAANSDSKVASQKAIVTYANSLLAAYRSPKLHNGILVESHTGGAATFALKTYAGNDPSSADPALAVFHDGSAILITSALSITIPSGATMGVTVNDIPFRLWFALINDGGTARIVVRNCRSFQSATWVAFAVSRFEPLMSLAGLTTTVMNTASDEPHVSYCNTAGLSGPLLVIGRADYRAGLPTAGSWTLAPTVIMHHLGDPLPGDVVHRYIQRNRNMSTGTATIPLDDTVPVANTDGFVCLQTLTGRDPQADECNVYNVLASAYLANSSTANNMAMFLVNGNNGIGGEDDVVLQAGFTSKNDTANSPAFLMLDHWGYNFEISSVIWEIRVGCGTAGTTTVNGQSGARRYGGVMQTTFDFKEIMG